MLLTRRRFLKTSALTAAALRFAASTSPARASSVAGRQGPGRRVIVVGAGLAGLAAAYRLREAGHDVLVLEAQRRPGGRVLTIRDFAEDLCGEAGATRIPDSHTITLGYARLFGLELDPFLPPGASVYHIRGQRLVVGPKDRPAWPLALTSDERELGLSGAFEKAYGGLVARLNPGDPTPPEIPDDLWRYDGMGWSELLQERGLSRDAIHLRRVASGGWDDTFERDSALRRLRIVALEPGGATYFKIRGGNDRLPAAFARRLADRILYGRPVLRVERTDGARLRVIFSEGAGHESLNADRVVMAVPFTLLRRMTVVPAFSGEKTRAIQDLAYSACTKVFLQTRTRFWAKDGLSGFGYTDLVGYMQVWELGHTQPGTRGLLVGYAKMAGARELGGLSEERRVATVREAITKVHPGLDRECEGGLSKCWDDDPWSRGALSILRPGDMKRLDPHLAHPEGGVHFAGEHTSPWLGGWMQSALESGERVAREINEAL